MTRSQLFPSRQRLARLGVVLSVISLGVLSTSQSQATVTISQLGSDVQGNIFSYFGAAVAMSGDGTRVVVGAQSNGDSGAGQARVFNWNGSAWEQLGTDIDGEANSDSLGWSVAISGDGDRIAVGAVYNDGGGIDSGHVRVFHWNGSAWIQLGGDIDGKANYETAGNAVALSSDGNRVLVGAQGAQSNKGLMRVYQWDGSSWAQLGADIVGPAGVGRFGIEVDISDDGNTIAAMDLPSSGQGAALVFDWTGSSWQLRGSNIASYGSGILKGDIALSGDGSRVAVGSPRQDVVEVFQWTNDTWEKVGANIVGTPDDGFFGFKIELSRSGSRLAVGGPWNTGDAGRVRVFDFESGNWTEVVAPIEGAARSELGHGVGMSQDGTRLAIGAPNASDRTGRLQVFQLMSPEPEPDPEPPTNNNENAPVAPTTTIATNPDSPVTETQSATTTRVRDLPATGSSTHTVIWFIVFATGVALTVISRRQKLPPC